MPAAEPVAAQQFTPSRTVRTCRLVHFRRADGSLSVGVPNAAQLDADRWVKQRDGKRQYAVLSFESAEARERWQRLILVAP